VSHSCLSRRSNYREQAPQFNAKSPFTRVAAADLRDKVAQLEATDAEDVRATTLHGYCFGLLQREEVFAVTGRRPRILLEHEVDLMLRDIGNEFGDIRERRRLIEALVAGWARGLADHPGLATSPEERDFENLVMRWLREHQALLIGEVVPEAFRYLSHNPAAEALESFDRIIVDEYQDLNVIEQQLLEVLSEGRSLCIAGDDDQSIYSVRYANPEGILAFMARSDVEAVGAENPVHPAQATIRYSWMRPLKRSALRSLAASVSPMVGEGI
jgi:DNA helicase II / ATP-dependent DNA helicase PcrA